jgi:hypothetical protein
MKNRFMASMTVLTLALAGAFSVAVQAQTTEEGPGPSEQPSAPMEIGQPQYPSQSQPGQPQADQSGEEDQPAPSGEGPAKTDQGVGRVSMIHGDVSTQRGDSGDWSAAVLNQPVLNGDKVSTGAGGRAEVQLDFANILRLGSNAQANIANFTHKYIQIQLSQGLADYSVFNESEAEPEIDTPNVAVHPAHKDVVLRIEVQPDGDSIVIVRKGEAQISTPQGIAELKQGEMATVRGSGADARYKVSAAPERDDWDRWNSDRDRMIHNASSFRHTNKYYVGAEDLDANGRWEDAPDYGQVWVPNEPDGWVPYRDGNWVYEPYYGWTWVGYEPWGWAPYHYGRWMYYGNSWAWWPGPVWGGVGFYRPFWAPAYVSFFGFGGGWGFGFGWGGWGGFGWLPIGPCDRFFPWWGGYGGRFGVVNITNVHVTNINRLGGIAPLHGGTAFSNLRRINDTHISRAVSTVGAGKFGAGRTTAVAATHAQLSGAHMMTGNLPVVPTHASLSASGRAAAPSTIHNSSAQHFFGTQSTARPQPFQQQTAHLQQAMQQNHFSPVAAGGGGASGSVAESRGTASAAGKPSAGTPVSGRDASSREMTSGANRGAGNQPAANESGSRGNLRSFAPPNSSTRSESASPEWSASPTSSANRPESSSLSRGEPNRSEWKTFTPPSRSSEPAARSGGASESYSRGENGSYWNRTAPSSTYSRESGSSNYERGGSSRPQLNMRQPIVQPRSSGSYGGYHGAPSYGGGAPHSAPSYGGSHGGYSGGAPHSTPPSGGGHYSAPSSGGGHSSGGGSHASSGGGHSGGSHH